MSRDYHGQKIERWEKGGKYLIPVNEWGHYLNGQTQETENLPTEAEALTSPYGSLDYAVGSGDDFHCFDFAVLLDGRVVLHVVINSETGHFIMDTFYGVFSKDEAPEIAMGLCGQAVEWCAENGVRPNMKGWNQDPFYFGRAVAEACGALPRPLKRREPPKTRYRIGV